MWQIDLLSSVAITRHAAKHRRWSSRDRQAAQLKAWRGLAAHGTPHTAHRKDRDQSSKHPADLLPMPSPQRHAKYRPPSNNVRPIVTGIQPRYH